MNEDVKKALEMKEKILESGSYAQTEIIVSENIDMPYISTKLINCNPIDVALLFKMLDEEEKALLKRFPFIPSMLESIKTTEGETIEMKVERGEE
jgi:hypothetical protein